MPFLLKTEPDVYSFADLQREQETLWDGVTNPQAVKYLREMHPKEKLLIYHTGGVRAAVGTATVVSVDAGDPKVPLVRIRYGKALPGPKTLDEIKAAPLFAASPLLRQGRLSVVPLTDEQYQWFLSAK
ncbi:MAG: EVE domain-containing protein [Acidobacteriaceae bacterium]